MRPVPPSLPRTAVAAMAALVLACGGDGDALTGPGDRPGASLQVLGRGPVPERGTSDLWVVGGHAYTGTHGCRPLCGNRLLVWDVTGDAPVLVDSVEVDATTVNDVKVSPETGLAVLTHEGSSDSRNGVTLLDVTDPGRPEVLARHTKGLEGGVHNVWLDGPRLYVAVRDGGLRILDVSDPTTPRELASWYAGSSVVHDVYVRDGLAFVSHWDAGLVILDVGGGAAGGSPDAPVELSRVALDGETHNAWYWPDGGYVFVGEEDFAAPGRVHVVDVRDLAAPRPVASFRVGRAHPPHNFWLDEEREVLWIAYYGEGIRALDVSGELAGPLEKQGRGLGGLRYAGDSTFSFGVQQVGGRLYVSDLGTGLWVLEGPAAP